MRPDISRYARRRMTADDMREVEAAEPAHLRVWAITDPSGLYVTVKLLDGHAVKGAATARRTIDAFRLAVLDMTVSLPPVDPVEIVSVLHG